VVHHELGPGCLDIHELLLSAGHAARAVYRFKGALAQDAGYEGQE
jgi:hypothetical protein